jgi:ribonuclease HI
MAQYEFAANLVRSPARPVRRFSGCTLSEARARIEKEGDELNASNPWMNAREKRDELKSRAGYWKAIGASSSVMSWVLNGVPLLPEREIPRMAFPSRRMTEEEAEFVDRQMDKHMKTGAYRVVEPHEVHVVNPLLVEPKKGKDGFRLVLDARFPNSYLAYAKFKLSSLQTDVPPLVRPGDHLFTVDLEAAYYSVPLAENAWGKMGWTHRGRHFVTSVLPFGVTIAPLVFTKIVHAIRELFHVLGVRMTDYLDDFLFAATPAEAKELAEFVRWLLKLLGWGFSDKGTLTPAHRVEFLGVIIDTHRFVFEVQPAKAAAALALAQRILTALETGERRAPKRDLQILGGKLGSMRLALRGARAWTRDILRAGGDGQGDAEPYGELVEELRHWTTLLPRHDRLSCPIRSPRAEVELWTDVSTAGWGAHLGTEERVGWIPRKYAGHSSTAREMTALMCAAEAFESQLTGKRVRVFMDSKAAVANFTKEGGPVPELCAMVKEWVTWLEHHNIEPVYVWVPRKQNERADQLSRVNGTVWRPRSDLEKRVRTEWARLWTAAGAPGEPKWLSPDWATLKGAIHRYQVEKRAGYIVTPDWPGQSWWLTIVEHERAHLTLPFMEVYEPPVDTRVRSPGWLIRIAFVDFRERGVARTPGCT